MSGNSDHPAITEDEIRRLVSVVVDEAMAVKGSNAPPDAATIAIGADHGGYALKETIIEATHLTSYHILINNTGGPKGGPIFSAEVNEFTQAFSNHLVCNQILVQNVVPGMKEAGYGRIINIISTSVKQPIDGLGVSNTIRGAVASWSKTLANELGPFGITVNNVLPGFTATDRLEDIIGNAAKRFGGSEEEASKFMKNLVPARRFAEPSEIANAVAFLASEAASYINGINLPVDGGRTKSL